MDNCRCKCLPSPSEVVIPGNWAYPFFFVLAKIANFFCARQAANILHGTFGCDAYLCAQVETYRVGGKYLYRGTKKLVPIFPHRAPQVGTREPLGHHSGGEAVFLQRWF